MRSGGNNRQDEAAAPRYAARLSTVGLLILCVSCSRSPHHVASSSPLDARARPLLDRMQIEGTREVAPGQSITVLRIQDEMLPEERWLDRHCMIYEHAAFRIAQFVCLSPGMDSDR